MMAVKWSMPYIPRLETVNVPPWNSAGLSLPRRARSANALISVDIWETVLLVALKTIGVIRPSGEATATEMSACLCCRMNVPCHELLTAGTLGHAIAAALTIKSLMDSLRGSPPVKRRLGGLGRDLHAVPLHRRDRHSRHPGSEGAKYVYTPPPRAQGESGASLASARGPT